MWQPFYWPTAVNLMFAIDKMLQVNHATRDFFSCKVREGGEEREKGDGGENGIALRVHM